METSALSVGRTYYQVTFADPAMTMPGVEPLVFIGHLELEDGGDTFAFQDTISYVRFGSALNLKENHEEIAIYFMSESDVAALEDITGVAREISEAASRAAAANYPILKVSRSGWKSAS